MDFDARAVDRLAALWQLRLRTRRLLLRPLEPTGFEALRQVALAGVHDPATMPFAVAWTDEPGLPGFVEFHRAWLDDWQPDNWSLAFAVWAGPALIGVQNVTGNEFASRRVVDTGSWLGAAHQRRGYGTEMRAAVLEFAFRGLGAEIARSGYLDGNDASRRVSEKLGYRIVGRRTESPRGRPVGPTDVELRREDWRSPIRVEIEGLEPALSLFGV
jgi:RimJ/RimL family protein N-acetyltransferase